MKLTSNTGKKIFLFTGLVRKQFTLMDDFYSVKRCVNLIWSLVPLRKTDSNNYFIWLEHFSVKCTDFAFQSYIILSSFDTLTLEYQVPALKIISNQLVVSLFPGQGESQEQTRT